MASFELGFKPALVCFDSWYGSIENLKQVRSLDWHFLTRLKANRQIRVAGGPLQAARKPDCVATELLRGSKAWEK